MLTWVKFTFVDKETVVNHVSSGFKEFCEKTSMHGFSELYKTKSRFWRIVWLLVILTAIAVTAYQTYTTTKQYIEHTTGTIIGPVEETDVYYPPFRLCYWQWYFWVDWSKAMSINCSKYSLLYIFTYFNTIYSSEIFDLGQARQEFQDIMMRNNFTSISEFYLSVSRQIPIEAENNVDKYFDNRVILFKEPYFLFCYEITEANMQKYFTVNKKNKVISFNLLDESYDAVNSFLTRQEYNSYNLRWSEKGSMYKVKNNSSDLSKFAPPITILVSRNVPKGSDVIAENDMYQIDVSSSAYTWLNTPNKVCLENQRQVASANTTCQELCEANFRRKACNCMRFDQAMLLKLDTTNNTCHKDLYFINLKNDTVLTNATLQYKDRDPYICDENKYLPYWQTCMNACVPACQIWKFQKTVSIKSTSTVIQKFGTKNMTKINVQYPGGSDIVMMTEVDLQSWETFVGNVGGLLGIWTGASVVSFIQLFYLCCFSGRL